MDYTNMMKDYVSYIKRHKENTLTADSLGRIHSYRGEYISYIFSCYYMEHLDSYIETVKNSKENAEPKRRILKNDTVRVRMKGIPSFAIEAAPVVKKESDEYCPVEAAVQMHKEQSQKETISLWWHDEEYKSHYMQGCICEGQDEVQEGFEYIAIPAGSYAVFSMDRDDRTDMAEALKTLFLYAHTVWEKQNPNREDEHGYNFQYFAEGKVYYCLALKKEEDIEPLDKIYSVDSWVEYIDRKLTSNLTVTSLAKKFNYSTTHFKRIFRMYYKMSVADYIRRRRLITIAEAIREGFDYMETADVYGFKTYTGFARAFKKEFHVSPAVYSRGLFEVIDLKKYYAQYKDRLRLSVVEMPEIHMAGKTIIPAKGEEIDIPAQVSYWIGKEFPGLTKTRSECNIEIKDDKIALWYQEEDSGDIEYILGPVMDDPEEEVLPEMIKVTLQAGKYAIFETEKMTDEEDVAETLRMYIRCVFYGWIKEHRERVDLSRLTFERYENGKIYLYVPVYC